MTEWMTLISDKMPELLTFHLNLDDCFWLKEYMIKMKRLHYVDESEKFRVNFRVW